MKRRKKRKRRRRKNKLIIRIRKYHNEFENCINKHAHFIIYALIISLELGANFGHIYCF